MANKTEFLESISERDFNVRETLDQIKGTNLFGYYSWGTSRLTNFENKVLILQVNGRHHKGKVIITLAWDDTYTVRIMNNQFRELEKFEMVYCDMLFEIIDNRIETVGTREKA